MLVLDENLPGGQRLWLRKSPATRMGRVVRVHADGLWYWQVGERSPKLATWDNK
jgi:hypothetical protein